MAGHGSAILPAERNPDSINRGAIRMVAPVNTSYCRLDEAEIFIQRLKPSGERMYAIHDARGKLAFDVTRGSDPTTSSAVLRDVSGTEVLVLRKEFFDARNAVWAAYRSEVDENGRKNLFTVRKIKKLSPSFEIEFPSHTKGQDSEGPIFTARTKRLFQGELSSLRDGRENTIARARKSLTPSIHVEKSQYGVTIGPGVDSAFIAAICITADLFYQNWSNNTIIPRSPAARIPRTISENAEGWTSHLARHQGIEQERILHAESSLDIYAGRGTSETSGTSETRPSQSTLAITLTCTLSLGRFLRTYFTLAEVMISIYLAIF